MAVGLEVEGGGGFLRLVGEEKRIGFLKRRGARR